MDYGPNEASPLSTQLSEALVARMSRLERENGLLRRLSLILGLGAIAALGISLIALSSSGFFRGGNRTFVGRSVVLRDAQGLVRGTWEIGENGATTLQLQDRNQIGRIRLSVLETGDPGIALTDPRGRTRIVVGLLPEQGGTLAFADEQGNTRVVLGMAPDESTTLVFVDATGITRAGLGVAADGNPALTLYEDARAAPDTSQDMTSRGSN